MDEIKKYFSVHAEDESLSFRIKRMEELYDLHQGEPDEPHRHDFFTILIVDYAKGCHYIDFESFELKPRQLFFLSPGQIHQLAEEDRSIGFALNFTRSFLEENGISLHFIEDLHLFQDCGHTPPLQPEKDDFDKILELAISMEEFQSANDRLSYEGIGALLKLLLIHSQASCHLTFDLEPAQQQASLTQLREFKSLVESKHREWHKVQQYADHMHITADYLHQVVKQLTGKSPKEHIASRLEVAARRLLRFSPLSNKEISYELGFSEASNFSQFFKKQNGQSPSAFRSAE